MSFNQNFLKKFDFLHRPIKLDKMNFNKRISGETKYTKHYHSFVISVSEKRKKEMSKKLEKDFTFIGKKYSSKLNKQERDNLLNKDHFLCWKKAQEMGVDGAFFFEDDVIFVPNWRNYIEEILNKYKVGMIRFDAIPYYTSDKNLYNNEIIFHECVTWGCVGGYYLSKNSIDKFLNKINNINSDGNVIEYLVLSLSQKCQVFTITSTPRICIQDWYAQEKSTLQTDNHMDKVRYAQSKYLDKYKSYYPDYLKYKK